MKYSVTAKFVAVALCALMLTMAVLCGLGMLGMAQEGIFSGKTVADLYEEQLMRHERYFAEEAAHWWASEKYGETPAEMVDSFIEEMRTNFFEEDCVFWAIVVDQEEVFNNYNGDPYARADVIPVGEVVYDVFHGWVDDSFDWEELENRPESWDEKTFVCRNYNAKDGLFYTYAKSQETLDAEQVEVVLYLMDGYQPDQGSWELMGMLERHKTQIVAGFVLGLLFFAATAVYLCCSAGHKPGSEEIRAAGLNVLPLDLYAAGVLCTIALAFLAVDAVDHWLVEQSWQVMFFYLGCAGYAVCLVFVGFCFACAAQFKMGGFHWLRNSICGRCLRLALWFCKKGLTLLSWMLPRVKKMMQWCFRLALRLLKDAWKLGMGILSFTWAIAQKIWRWSLKQLMRGFKQAEHFFSLLPLTWQWLLVGFGMIFLMTVTLTGRVRSPLGVAGCVAIVLYGAGCFGSLMDAVKKMRSGDLETKVDGKFLIGSFREFSEELNGLADVAMVAAQKQLKSERMKTELITNVSHDIKTPLTSIINYVDLLKKPHTQEEGEAYLEVVDRQSQRMKKLIEDLMEMSKASTGNIPVEIGEIDAVEAVNQALGEFADKLANAGLTIVFHQPEEPVLLLADGRLLWRAMSNVLSNAVKYALPGTRLYADISAVEDKVMISFKNISGAQLNISADELMERFVRGDSSRNTEGSGLGLNIAKSLMELQKGQLQLLVDGDLFKVTLVFPKA